MPMLVSNGLLALPLGQSRILLAGSTVAMQDQGILVRHEFPSLATLLYSLHTKNSMPFKWVWAIAESSILCQKNTTNDFLGQY
ncbi:hypothetical protein D3C73_1523260 [compost metagenome]